MRRYIEWLLRESRDTIEILSQDCLTLGANQASTIDTSPNGFTFWMIGTVCHCAQRWLLRLWNETAIPLSPIPIFCHRISVALVGFVSPAIRASHFNLLDSFNDRGCYLLTTSCFYLLFSCCSISTTSLDILIVSSNTLYSEFQTQKGHQPPLRLIALISVFLYVVFDRPLRNTTKPATTRAPPRARKPSPPHPAHWLIIPIPIPLINDRKPPTQHTTAIISLTFGFN